LALSSEGRFKLSIEYLWEVRGRRKEGGVKGKGGEREGGLELGDVGGAGRWEETEERGPGEREEGGRRERRILA
jgi:hypothetical protein